MSKVPPQLRELVLEAFQQFNFFTKHYKLPTLKSNRGLYP
jgi:hypothetical protein